MLRAMVSMIVPKHAAGIRLATDQQHRNIVDHHMLQCQSCGVAGEGNSSSDRGNGDEAADPIGAWPKEEANGQPRRSGEL